MTKLYDMREIKVKKYIMSNEMNNLIQINKLK